MPFELPACVVGLCFPSTPILDTVSCSATRIVYLLGMCTWALMNGKALPMLPTALRVVFLRLPVAPHFCRWWSDELKTSVRHFAMYTVARSLCSLHAAGPMSLAFPFSHICFCWAPSHTTFIHRWLSDLWLFVWRRLDDCLVVSLQVFRVYFAVTDNATLCLWIARTPFVQWYAQSGVFFFWLDLSLE